MQRFRPAVGLLAVAALVSSVVVAAVEAAGELVPLRDRPGLARPVPQDAPSDVPECQLRDNNRFGTCVTIRNETSNTALRLQSFEQGEPGVVYQQPPQTLAPGQSGMWITAGRARQYHDIGHARYLLPAGSVSAIDYETGRGTGTLSVTTLDRTTRDTMPYCTVQSLWRPGLWMSRVVTYSDTGFGIRGHCFALLEGETEEPTPDASPDTPAPAGP